MDSIGLNGHWADVLLEKGSVPKNRLMGQIPDATRRNNRHNWRYQFYQYKKVPVSSPDQSLKYQEAQDFHHFQSIDLLS
jgi:hypothetical protein